MITQVTINNPTFNSNQSSASKQQNAPSFFPSFKKLLFLTALAHSPKSIAITMPSAQLRGTMRDPMEHQGHQPDFDILPGTGSSNPHHHLRAYDDRALLFNFDDDWTRDEPTAEEQNAVSLMLLGVMTLTGITLCWIKARQCLRGDEGRNQAQPGAQQPQQQAERRPDHRQDQIIEMAPRQTSSRRRNHLTSEQAKAEAIRLFNIIDPAVADGESERAFSRGAHFIGDIIRPYSADLGNIACGTSRSNLINPSRRAFSAKHNVPWLKHCVLYALKHLTSQLKAEDTPSYMVEPHKSVVEQGELDRIDKRTDEFLKDTVQDTLDPENPLRDNLTPDVLKILLKENPQTKFKALEIVSDLWSLYPLIDGNLQAEP